MRENRISPSDLIRGIKKNEKEREAHKKNWEYQC